MTMIRSRPGFQTQRIEDQTQTAPPAKLNPDMIPALAKRSAAQAEQSKSPLLQDAPGNAPSPFAATMQAAAERALQRMQAEQQAKGPDVIVNPNPSATPIVTSPHK